MLRKHLLNERLSDSGVWALIYYRPCHQRPKAKRPVIWGNGLRREGEGSGRGEAFTPSTRPGETQLEGTGGRDSAGSPARTGREICEKHFHHRLPAPGARARRIAFSVRISKAALGLFWSGNLILRWVYFSTLENSQCRTRSEPHPACPQASVLPRQALRAGAVERAGRGGHSDRPRPSRRLHEDPTPTVGWGQPGERSPAGAHSSYCCPTLGRSWASAPPLASRLEALNGVARPEEPSPEDARGRSLGRDTL